MCSIHEPNPTWFIYGCLFAVRWPRERASDTELQRLTDYVNNEGLLYFIHGEEEECHLELASIVSGQLSSTPEEDEAVWRALVRGAQAGCERPDFVIGFICGATGHECPYNDSDWWVVYGSDFDGDEYDDEVVLLDDEFAYEVDDNYFSEYPELDESADEQTPTPTTSPEIDEPTRQAPTQLEISDEYGRALRSIEIDLPQAPRDVPIDGTLDNTDSDTGTDVQEPSADYEENNNPPHA